MRETSVMQKGGFGAYKNGKRQFQMESKLTPHSKINESIQRGADPTT